MQHQWHAHGHVPKVTLGRHNSAVTPGTLLATIPGQRWSQMVLRLVVRAQRRAYILSWFDQRRRIPSSGRFKRLMERRRHCQIACQVSWPWLALGHPPMWCLPLGLHGFRLLQGRYAPSAVEEAVRTVPRQKRLHQLPMRPLAAIDRLWMCKASYVWFFVAAASLYNRAGR